MDSNNIKKDNDSKKITFVLVAILVLMLTTTGGTYAFFALSANNASTVTGTAATASLTLTVTKAKPTSAGTGVMVPQLSYNADSTNKNILKLAIDSNCIDSNNNIVCQVYNIVIKNTSSAAARFNTTFTLSGGTYSNLKWYKLAEGGNTTGTPSTTYTYPSTISAKYGNAKSVTALGTTSNAIAKNAYYYYVVVVWIEETGNNQNSTDTGTFTGTIAVSAADTSGNNIGGITSTITSGT